MSQPYYPPPPTQDYRTTEETVYATSGALTKPHRPATGSYYPSTSYIDPRDDNRLDRPRHHHQRRRSRSSSVSTDEDDEYYASHRGSSRRENKHERHREEKSSRDRSLSRARSIGATALGGAAGAFAGHQFGGKKNSTIATLGGLAAGAWGAHELEKRYEKEREKKRFKEEGFSYGGGGGSDREDRDGGHRRRGSGGGIVDKVQDKIGGFIDQLDGKGEKEEKRRSRSHAPRSSKYDDDSDYEYYDRRSRRDGY